MIYNKLCYGVMAQLVERLVRNEEASGSNPLSSTKTKHAFGGVFFVLWLSVRSVRCIISGSREERKTNIFYLSTKIISDDALATCE